MSEIIENFDFMELGQAIQDAREKQRITREELAEELGISARHLQSVEKEGQYPSFRLFIQLVTMFHISVPPINATSTMAMMVFPLILLSPPFSFFRTGSLQTRRFPHRL